MIYTPTKVSENQFGDIHLSEERFSPCIYDVAELGLMYVDGRMIAAVEIDNHAGLNTLAISTWDCDIRGKGYSRVALEWFRDRFDLIVVHGAGEIDEDGVGDIATGYWEHMLGSGLVDTVFLDNGSELVIQPCNASGRSAV
ncbi:hypothetical protein G6L37_06425 [Agrobacterium rubi]|nr:hypothetical protein [Agrobacterium rubi]NTF24998.1 hypothetical protein [Agrobacterium rubi]